MSRQAHKLIVIYTEISDWVKNFKEFNTLTENDVYEHLCRDFNYTRIPEEDQEEIVKLILDLFKAIKR